MTENVSPGLPVGPVYNFEITTQPAGYSSMTSLQWTTPMTATYEMHPQGFKDKVVALLSAYEDLVAQAHACPATAPECLAEEGRTKVHELREELGL